VWALSNDLELEKEKLKRHILLSDSTRWPPTATQPSAVHTPRGLGSQYFECRPNWILTKCMLELPELGSKNGLCEPISIETAAQRERTLKARVEKRKL